jgi:hypothetical protein
MESAGDAFPRIISFGLARVNGGKYRIPDARAFENSRPWRFFENAHALRLPGGKPNRISANACVQPCVLLSFP